MDPATRERRERVRMRMQKGNLANVVSIQRAHERLREAEAAAMLVEYHPDGRPIRRRQKKVKKIKARREPNQWQLNLTAWNAGNSGWCIPKKGTADYVKVKNFHIRRGLEVETPPTLSRRPGYADFYDVPTPQQLTYEERPRPATAEVSHEAIAKLRADLNALKQRQTDLAANRRATIV